MLSKRVTKVYHSLHAIPETGFNEQKTSEYIAHSLLEAGYEVQTNVGGTGVIGTLRGKEAGPVVAIRADMDALPYVVDDKECAIHSCGHDAHSAMVLTVAEEAASRGIRRGTLKILFQPAEETLRGALEVIETGAINDIDIIVGMHLRPLQEAKLKEATPALQHASCYIMEVVVNGQPAHGARPYLGVNAIDAAAAIVNAINAIHIDPTVPSSIKVTTLHAGGKAPNIIPGEAKLTLDLRSQDNETMTRLIEKATKAIQSSAMSVGATSKITIKGGVPAAEYSPEIVDIAKEAILTVLGNDGLLPPIITPGGEDFHFYVKHKPAIKAGYIGLGCNLSPGLHHPAMNFDTAALIDGVNIFIYIVNKLVGFISNTE